MRPVTAAMLEGLSGSIAGASMTFNAWYGGVLVSPSLPVDSWSIEFSGDQQTVIQGKLSLTVVDPSGQLSPWGYDEPLAVGGSRIQCQFGLGMDVLPYGWFVISQNAPSEAWRVSGPNLTWVSGGASVPVTADDLTLLAQDYKFMAPEAPPANTTVMAELKRLMGAVGINVIQGAGVVDVPVPSSVAYTKERINAVYDLARLVGWPRMTGDGQLEIYSTAKTAPVWLVQGGNEGALVSFDRAQDRSTLFNAVVSTSTQATPEIIGYAYVSTGTTAFDGTLGRKPDFHNAIATTQDGVNQDAATYLATKIQNQTQTLKVICLPHPGIQVGDWVRVATPVISGASYPLDGLVLRTKLSGDAGGLKAMEMDVQCTVADVTAVAKYIRTGASSAQLITPARPALVPSPGLTPSATLAPGG